ncbi:hypothetical protein RI129_006850 [Pyrocoelia pectoralis]|uniref:Retrotransposon gag domain-containing protein n=1 Tax=Pyrocoelia pectoralis TaxID=417401 RepID=A0AAN7VBH9_9COLE
MQHKKQYDEVVKAFENYCIPRKNIIAESFKFHQQTQKQEESFDHFLTELRKQTKLCEFGDQEERMIRDRIVFGTNDVALQERLLRLSDLTLIMATNQARAAEAGKIQIKALQEKQPK